MEDSEARHQLLLHGPGTIDTAGEPLILEDGFLGSLRPYTALREANFHQVMEALLVVGDRFRQAKHVDREIVLTVWSICSTARVWGLHPDGMLQRNKLITAADTARLDRWVSLIEGATLQMLGGWPPHWAVVSYAEYVVEVGWTDNIAGFIPLFEKAVSDPELVSGGIEAVVDALGKLGPLATTTIPALLLAEKRSYTWYTPEDRCTAEVRERIRVAIKAIAGTQ
jgi:hypothetical protein